MLKEIRIRNLGVIDDATLDFGPGLNVLSGETGAGKTMVVQGMGLLLGGRADPGLVRRGADRASVDGVADLPDGHPALERAVEAGGDVGDGLIIARTVAAEGRSRAIVGGRTAPASVLADIAEHLVAVHGQADQWRLQRPDQHRVMLDDFGGGQVGPALAAYQELFARWQQTTRTLRELTEHARERAQRLDLLTSGLDEIERVAPTSGEDVSLTAEIERLQHVDALREAAGSAHDALVGRDDVDLPQALELLTRARSALDTGHDETLAAIGTRLHEVEVLVVEAATDLSAYLSDLDADPARLGAALDRKAELAVLLRKYGDTLDDVIEWSRQSAREVDELAGSDDRIEQLATERDQLAVELATAADKLSDARGTAAAQLQDQVTAELAHLAMGTAQVHVDVRRRTGEYTAYGQDEVEILMAANKGATPRPVAKAASGGELSRLMLALEVVTGSGDVPTFVFDEVDAGVGGAAALDVGSRLKELSRHAQVVVVTHLAQVAAYADRHLVVHKQNDGQVTRSDVRAVEGQDRIAEIARMLSGHSDTDEALAHAAKLLEQAGQPATEPGAGTPARTRHTTKSTRTKPGRTVRGRRPRDGDLAR